MTFGAYLAAAQQPSSLEPRRTLYESAAYNEALQVLDYRRTVVVRLVPADN